MISCSDPLGPIALAATLFCSVLCMRAAAQEPTGDEGRALLERLDRARLPAAKLADHTLVVEGTYEVRFEGMPGEKPAAAGAFRDVYRGADLARHTTDMGAMGKLERGRYHDVFWEVDPGMGAKVHGGVHEDAVRRYFTWMRGAPIAGLYTAAAPKGTAKAGETECDVWQLSVAKGKADLLYVDAAGTVQRIDMALPTPESAGATWDMDDAMLAELTFGDWTEVDGVRHARRRTLRMGPATVAFVATAIRAGDALAEEAFVPPPAVAKVRRETAGPAVGPDGKPTYQVVDREAQLVASIRVQCKADHISHQLATMLPEVMAHLTEVGGKVAGPPFSRYHSFADGMIELEAGIPVQQKVTEKGRVKNAELPGGKALTAWHIGPYTGLTAAHEALRAQMAERKLEARGAVWEVYWTDPGMVPDESKWRTQLFQPVK